MTHKKYIYGGIVVLMVFISGAVFVSRSIKVSQAEAYTYNCPTYPNPAYPYQPPQYPTNPTLPPSTPYIPVPTPVPTPTPTPGPTPSPTPTPTFPTGNVPQIQPPSASARIYAPSQYPQIPQPTSPTPTGPVF